MTDNKKLATMIHLAADELFAHDLIDGEKISYRDLLEASRIVGTTSQARDTQPTLDGLPPLPEHVAHGHSNAAFCWDRHVTVNLWPLDLYTADQMREYGALCRAAPNGEPSREVVARIVVTKSGAVVESWGMLPPLGEYALCRCDAPAQPDLVKIGADSPLLPCPHCGSADVELCGTVSPNGYSWVQCFGCGSKTQEWDRFDKSVGHWNRRAQPNHIEASRDERQLFEAWYTEKYTDYIPMYRGEYANLDTLLAWKAWKAGRASIQAAPPAPVGEREVPSNLTTDQYIELAEEIQKTLVRDAIKATREAAAMFNEGPFRAGLETACDEIETRLGFEITDTAASPQGATSAHTAPARDDALEEAARVCDRHANSSWNDDRRAQAKMDAGEIRKLKDPNAAPAVGDGERAALAMRNHCAAIIDGERRYYEHRADEILSPSTKKECEKRAKELAKLKDKVLALDPSSFAALQPTVAPVSEQDKRDDAGCAMYDEFVNQQAMHCNRFPAWSELAPPDKESWRKQAAEAIAGKGNPE